MMPRERISFLKAETTRSRSGQLVDEWLPASEILANVPAERRKRKVANDEAMNAKEQFIELKIVFWLRYDDSITDDLRIVYNGKLYKILDIDRNFYDNSCLITCIKINN